APFTSPAPTQPLTVPSAAATHCAPGVPGSTSVIGATSVPNAVNRSPAATTFPYPSRTASEVTREESTPSATRVSGAAWTVKNPRGTFGEVTTLAAAAPSEGPE